MMREDFEAASTEQAVAGAGRDRAGSDSERRASRVLVVDDDDLVRRTFARVLSHHGCTVITAPHGHQAIELLADGDFDVIVSDVQMPDISGIELLRQVRSHDLELPVILVTGAPTVATAAQAVDYGATKYLSKPVEPSSLIDAVERAAKLRRLARTKRRAMSLAGIETAGASDRAGAEVQFERALSSLWMAYQPIVSAAGGAVYAYEALMRSDEPGLPHPGAVLSAAERLGQVHALGRVVRSRAAMPIDRAPTGALLFVNLHPAELDDPQLTDPDAPLGRVASRVVLEITERTSLGSIRDVAARVAKLRAIGYRIAVDDLGAGYAGLSSFAQLEPEFVKIDMSLVRDVGSSLTRQKVIRSMATLCADLGMRMIAEGVETDAERDALIELGCPLLQGYRFARPDRPFPTAHW